MKNFINQFQQIMSFKKALCLLVCLGLLCGFQSSFDAKAELTKNIAENFTDGNPDSNPNEENFESQDLVLNHDGDYTILKVSTKNSGFANHLPISGFTLAIATPPPNFLI